MLKITPAPFKAPLSAEDRKRWEETLAAGAIAQSIAGGVAVGGTAAAIYAGHRLSLDTDHLLNDLRDHFDEILEKLDDSPEWTTARLKRPVLILGSINNCEVGFRQALRTSPVETVTIETQSGTLIIPTLDELIAMKAVLCYRRSVTRDFLDFAALTECTDEETVLRSLLKIDDRYGNLQSNSLMLEVARTLAAPEPEDLEDTDPSDYKALAPEWHNWEKTFALCQRFGRMLGERLLDI